MRPFGPLHKNSTCNQHSCEGAARTKQHLPWMLTSSTLPNTPELGLMRVGATHESEDGPHTPHLTLQTRFEASPLNRFVEVAQVSSAALTEQAWGDQPRSLPGTFFQPRRPRPGGLPGCFPEGSWKLPGSFPDTSQKLPGSFPEVLGIGRRAL